jgi:hypothetical protein
LPQVNTQFDAIPKNGISPIAILYAKYASLKETALAENLFTISNQQIYDVPNRTTSPYNTNNLFLAAPINNEFRDTVRLTFDSGFFYKNMNVLVSNAYVDFKDGQGYHTLSSFPIQKVYTDSSGRKPIVLKVITTDGNTFYCNSSVVVSVNNSMAYRYIDNDPLQANIPVPIVQADGIGGGDFMQIRYAKNNPTRLQQQQHVRKPLIFVEGYDASNKYDIYSLIRNSPNSGNNGEWLNLIRDGYDFMNDLDDLAGYDLVFVNYNTFRSFEDNTKMLQRVLEWVNADKAIAGSTEKNVVLGVSAGGVLARYTLARMTKNIGVNSTDTRLLLTMDSPHQGANVPLALQHFLYDLGEQTVLGQKIKDNNADLKNFIQLNNQPATAQLLKARVVDGNGTVVYNTFLNGPNSPYQQMVRFDALYNPNNVVPPYKFLAVSQGSQCGAPVTAPSINFASQDAEFAIFRFWFPPTPWTPFIYVSSKWWLTSQLNALPNNGVDNIEYFKFERRIKLWGIGFGWKTLSEHTRQNPVGYVGWDAAPGGTQSIKDRTDGGLSTGTQSQPFYKNWYGFPFASLKAGVNLSLNQDVFSFVPTVSALDAPFGISLNTVFNFTANGNSNTATFKYQAQSKETGSTLFNRNHTDYTPRNAKWIYNEMENITQTVTCEEYCNNSNVYVISGTRLICSSASYSIANLPTGSTVTWSLSSPSTALSLIPNGNQVTVTNNNSGIANRTLIATITVPNCAIPIVISKPISADYTNGASFPYTQESCLFYNVQHPAESGNIFFGPPVFLHQGCLVRIDVSSILNQGKTVTLSPNTSMIPTYWHVFDGFLMFTMPIGSGGYPLVFDVNGEGACSNKTLQIFSITGNGREANATMENKYSYSPNPVSDRLNISLNTKVGEKESSLPKSYFIKIAELNTQLILKQIRVNNSGNTFQIDMTGLRTGYYSVEINDGKETQVIKVFKL